MNNNEINMSLIEKLDELTSVEILKAKILAILFKKMTRKITEDKINTLKYNFENQAKYYGQNVDEYDNTYVEIISRYKEQLRQILNKYNEMYVNITLELQEAECNQKITIANIKNTFEIKERLQGKATDEIIQEYINKLEACIEKKKNYDFVIYKCEQKMQDCIDELEPQVNTIFAEKNEIVPIQDENNFNKIISKIKNLFSGKKNFNNYVIKPMNANLERIDGRLINITNIIRSKMAKDEINVIYDNMV